MAMEDIHNKTQSIRKDLDLIRNKHIFELENAPGIAKCSTFADRIEKNLDQIVNDYEEIIKKQRKSADQEQFKLLFGLLKGLVGEIANLSKKQPDGLVNAFKVGKINNVLIPLRDLMKDEPSAEFLDLVVVPENDKEKSRNSYSDVAVILSQYFEACREYNIKYYSDDMFGLM